MDTKTSNQQERLENIKKRLESVLKKVVKKSFDIEICPPVEEWEGNWHLIINIPNQICIIPDMDLGNINNSYASTDLPKGVYSVSQFFDDNEKKLGFLRENQVIAKISKLLVLEHLDNVLTGMKIKKDKNVVLK